MYPVNTPSNSAGLFENTDAGPVEEVLAVPAQILVCITPATWSCHLTGRHDVQHFTDVNDTLHLALQRSVVESAEHIPVKLGINKTSAKWKRLPRTVRMFPSRAEQDFRGTEASGANIGVFVTGCLSWAGTKLLRNGGWDNISAQRKRLASTVTRIPYGSFVDRTSAERKPLAQMVRCFWERTHEQQRESDHKLT